MSNRKARIKEQNRTDILDAAERIFARMGFHLATVELIAQEAEFAVGTLYNFFKNKQELYEEVMERVGDRFLDRIEKDVIPHDDVYDASAALIDLILEQFNTHQGLLRDYVSIVPMTQLDPYCGLSDRCQEFYDKIIQYFVKIIEKGIKDEVFAKGDPTTLAVAFDGMCNSLIFYWARQESPPSLESQRETLICLSSRLLRAKPRNAQSTQD